LVQHDLGGHEHEHEDSWAGCSVPEKEGSQRPTPDDEAYHTKRGHDACYSAADEGIDQVVTHYAGDCAAVRLGQFRGGAGYDAGRHSGNREEDHRSHDVERHAQPDQPGSRARLVPDDHDPAERDQRCSDDLEYGECRPRRRAGGQPLEVVDAQRRAAEPRSPGNLYSDEKGGRAK
jgi:hypothetical protein